jgi:putative intracellular protease/amidase
MTLDRRTTLQALAGLALAPAFAATACAQQPPSAAGHGEVVAMLLYPRMTALDLVGPYHFLASTGIRVELVAKDPSLAPVPSDLGLALQPTASFETCPSDVEMIFVPGGTNGTIAAARDAETVAFVRDRAARARYVTSVCTGSLILGVAGALRGKRATSHWIARDLLTQFEAIPTQGRVVRDGGLITGGGVSAGLDFGLMLVAELRGEAEARAIQLISEYDPEPPLDSGSPETAPAETVAAIRSGLARFVEEARALRIAAT